MYKLALSAKAHADVGLLLVRLGLQCIDLLLDQVVYNVDVVVRDLSSFWRNTAWRDQREEFVLGGLLACV